MAKTLKRGVRPNEKPKTVRLKQTGAAMPPPKGAPQATYPVAVSRSPTSLAPVPINDRFPIVAGQQLSLQYLASVKRLATTGYRQQLVDLLNELLEEDPHLYSVVQKRILEVANGRVVIDPAAKEGEKDYALAKKVTEMVQREVARIPMLTQAFATLLWALYYALTAAEIHWTRDSDGWHIERLEFVHSRRLAYPDYQSWDLYVWDQGQVYGWNSGFGSSPTNNGMFGLRVADWPGKFIVFAPQLRGDYPTREGIGRETSAWSLFKRIGARGGSSYLERFAKTFMDVVYNRSDQQTGNPTPAEDEDIALAHQIGAQIGAGSGSYVVHSNSITLEPKNADGVGTSKLTWQEWIGLCNAEMSKAALGGTLGTEVGKGGGNRALGEVQERAEVSLEQFDATCLAETLRRDVVTTLVRLNMPEALHVVPIVSIHIDPDPDPKAVTEVAKTMTDMGLPVDGDRLAAQTGVELVKNESGEPRRTFRSDFADPMAVDVSLESEESKKAREDADKAQLEIAKAAAANPPAATPGKPGAKAAVKKPPSAKATKRLNDELRGSLLLSDRDDRPVATEVFDQLAEDYPKSALGWVLAAHWDGPRDVPMSQIDFSSRASWRASHEPIDAYVDRLREGKRKPVILVKTPGNPKLVITDGHHRTLASEKLGIAVRAYVATVRVDKGPWDELHDVQKGGSSKGSWI